MTIEKDAIKLSLLQEIIADLKQRSKLASDGIIVTQNFGDAMLNKELAYQSDAARELAEELTQLEEAL